MDALATVFAVLIFCAVVVFSLAYALRHRADISKWVNPTYFAEDDRKLRLQREIEDCQKELAWIGEQEQAETGE